MGPPPGTPDPFPRVVPPRQLAVRSYIGKLRRSEDAGKTWGKIQDIDIRILDSNLIVDENTGDIRSIRMWDGSDRAILSKDHGRTWTTEKVMIKPSARMRELAQSGTKVRGTKGANKPGTYFIHANASESGVTLRHGKHKGRLIISATYRPNAKEHPSDRTPGDEIVSCAIFSDDGGSTWQVSEFFPDPFTEEAALVELHDGRIYYNSRSHSGYYDEAFARTLRSDETMRRETWSDDGGRTWKDLRVSQILPGRRRIWPRLRNEGGNDAPARERPRRPSFQQCRHRWRGPETDDSLGQL